MKVLEEQMKQFTYVRMSSPRKQRLRNFNDSEDVDDKRVEDENITKHGGRFKEYCHQYPHTYTNEQENGSLRE